MEPSLQINISVCEAGINSTKKSEIAGKQHEGKKNTSKPVRFCFSAGRTAISLGNWGFFPTKMKIQEVRELIHGTHITLHCLQPVRVEHTQSVLFLSSSFFYFFLKL